MSSSLLFLLACEATALAFLPLTTRLFAPMPDRGYGFSKVVALLGTTYLVWLVGSFAPLARSPLLPALVVLLVAGVTWWLWHSYTVESLRAISRVVMAEELLFVAAFVFWTILRATVFHPGVSHTEQYMDMSLLGASIRSASYPPYDPWMSGQSLNYYYFGYLMFGTLTKLSTVSPTAGYNLALSFLFASTVAGAFSLAYALSRRLIWATIGPFFVAVMGNWHAALVQIPGGHEPSAYFWFWDSSRVIQTPSDYTINEFPYFSFMLGDLHPHVMALPVTLLAIAIAIAILFSPHSVRLVRRFDSLGLLAAGALCAGSLFTINSWDFPTYLFILTIAIVVNAYLSDATARWWKTPLLSVPCVAAAAVTFFLPFYTHFKSVARGLGWVTTPSAPTDFLQIFGLFLLAASLLMIALALVLQPAEDLLDESQEDQNVDRALEAGQARIWESDAVVALLLGAIALIVGARFGAWVLVTVLLIGAAALVMLLRVLNTEDVNRADAVALILVLIGCLVIAGTEVVYIKDSFDGSPSYRMNTVFKFYYQAWTMLGIAGSYATYRAWCLFGRYFRRQLAWGTVAVLAIGAAAGGVYTVLAPQSVAGLGGTVVGIDALAQFQRDRPTDYDAVVWLQQHVSGNPVELEAPGLKEYDTSYSRISAFTGLPTVIGWQAHEGQWRGPDPQIDRQSADASTIYTTHDVVVATRLLRRYNVRYVIVGDTERQISGADLGKFARFMHPAFRSGGTTIYQW